MAFDPDSIDGPPISSTALIDLDVKIMGSPYVNQKLKIPPKSKFAKDLFIRTGSVANTDLKTYDLGIFVIATDGFTVTTKIGALFVSYRTKLISPELPISGVGNVTGLSIESTTPTTASNFHSPTYTGTTALASYTAPNVITLGITASPILIAVSGTGAVAGVSALLSASVGTITNSIQTDNGTTTFTEIGVWTGGVVGATLTSDYVFTTGSYSVIYLSVLPTGITLSRGIDSKLFKQFMQFMSEEKRSRADEDKLLLHRVLEMQAELDEISFKRHQDADEGLSLSDEEEPEEVIVDASSHQKVVRLKQKEPRVEPQYNVESSFAHGSELARYVKKTAVKSRGDLLPTPTETISIGKGKDKV
jgi:hypothetical protein